MPKNIEIDILMTIHNGDKYLTQTINSLKSQKYKKWNLIIINNYSSNKTTELLSKINKSSKKIKVFNTKKLLTRPAVLNYGLRFCKSSYIGILDADDLVSPNWLKDIKNKISYNKSFGVIVGNYIPINEKNEKLKKKEFFKIKSGNINHTLSYTFPCAHSGSIINSNILKKFKQPYDESLMTGHDWKLFLKISFFNKILFVDKDWVFWRRYNQSITAKNKFISKTDILQNLVYAEMHKTICFDRMKNNIMKLVQLYHLLHVFIFNKQYVSFLFTLSVGIIFPLFYFNNNFLIKLYLKKIKKFSKDIKKIK